MPSCQYGSVWFNSALTPYRVVIPIAIGNYCRNRICLPTAIRTLLAIAQDDDRPSAGHEPIELGRESSYRTAVR
jgi:hypothetical protein